MTLPMTAARPTYSLAPLVQVATVTLTNADIKALRATPKTLVAAPGTGKFLEFVISFIEACCWGKRSQRVNRQPSG